MFPFGAITLIITASLDEACPVIVIVVEPSTASASISSAPNAAGAYAIAATNTRLAKIGNAFLDLRLTGRSTEDCVYKQSDSLLLVKISIFLLKNLNVI